MLAAPSGGGLDLRFRLLLALQALLIFFPSAARAEWREAVSKHFIVYSEGSERELRQEASDLEKYDFLLRKMLGVPDVDPVKLKIYLMADMLQVQKTRGAGTGNGVAGYYSASPRGPIAVGTRGDLGGRGFEISSRAILFHEYAHHLMLQYFDASFPSWYVEGFAEYYGMTRILPDNVIEVGRPATHRLTSIRAFGEWLPLNRLLAPQGPNDRALDLYSQGWLLMHYLADNEARKGQLSRYIVAINQGVPAKKAMDDAFGEDALALDKELRNHARKRTFEATRISFASLDIGPIETRTLGKAEQALLRLEIALGRRIFAREAADFVNEVREVASNYPGDPSVAAVLTEAEYLVDNRPAAREAVERWLALKPDDARAQSYKGLIEASELAAANRADKEGWASAIKWVTKARAAAPKDPLVLEAFYDVHAARGDLPPPRAQNALFQAMELMPQDDRLRHKVARDFERRELIEDAIAIIQPLTFGTHHIDQESEKQKIKRERWEEKWRRAGAEKLETPREMLARLAAKLASAQATPAETASGTR
jgi:hypothetical protein